MHTLQQNLTNAQIRKKFKPLQLDKDKDDVAKKACLHRENPIYDLWRVKHSLKECQCNIHNNTIFNKNNQCHPAK